MLPKIDAEKNVKEKLKTTKYKKKEQAETHWGVAAAESWEMASQREQIEVPVLGLP